ncbi:unnamed protein product, partial [Didymodactylos carnosus]
STTKRELWEQLRNECFSRLITYCYSSSFILSLTELVISALSGRLYSQSQQQTPLSVTTTKSAYAESSQNHFILSRDTQMACLDVIRYTTKDGLNLLIEDVRKATQLIFSRITLQQTLDIEDLIWYCSEIRHHLERKSTVIYSKQQQTGVHPFMKYVRSLPPLRKQPIQVPQSNETVSFSLANIVSNATSFFTTQKQRPPPPTLFNVQQQFELEYTEMIERWIETFHQVLTQVVEQSFSSIYDEFAREIATVAPSSTNTDYNIGHQLNPQLPLAKLIPICDKIYKQFSSNQEQLTIHFQNLACRKELHDYTRYVYDLFSNETDQSPSRTAYSLLPTLPSTTQFYNSNSGSNFDLTTLISHFNHDIRQLLSLIPINSYTHTYTHAHTQMIILDDIKDRLHLKLLFFCLFLVSNNETMVNDRDIPLATADNNSIDYSDGSYNQNQNKYQQNGNSSSLICANELSQNNGITTHQDTSENPSHSNNVTTIATITPVTTTDRITTTDEDLTNGNAMVQLSNNNEIQQNEEDGGREGGGESQDEFIRITGAHQTLIEAQQYEREKNYPLALQVYRICVDLLLEELMFTEGTDKSRVFLREKCTAIMDKVDELKKLLDPIELEQPLSLEHEREQPLSLEHEREQPLSLEHEHAHDDREQIVDHLQTIQLDQKQNNDQQQ